MQRTRSAISKEFFDKLLAAFRICPGNYSQAASRAGCDKRTAKRAWLRAWPDRGDWCRPIKDLLATEKLDAAREARLAADRAALAAEQARERRRAEAEKAHEEELSMLRVARGDVLAVLGMAMELIPVMREVGAIIKEAVAKDANGKRVKEISPTAAMALLTRHSQIVQKGVGAAEAVIQLSRLERGATTVNVGPAIPDEHLTYEDALQELDALSDLLHGAKAVGLLARASRAAEGSAGGVGGGGVRGGRTGAIDVQGTLVGEGSAGGGRVGGRRMGVGARKSIIAARGT